MTIAGDDEAMAITVMTKRLLAGDAKPMAVSDETMAPDKHTLSLKSEYDLPSTYRDVGFLRIKPSPPPLTTARAATERNFFPSQNTREAAICSKIKHKKMNEWNEWKKKKEKEKKEKEERRRKKRRKKKEEMKNEKWRMKNEETKIKREKRKEKKKEKRNRKKREPPKRKTARNAY